MLKPIAFAIAVTAVALAAQAQDQTSAPTQAQESAAPPPGLSESSDSASLSSDDPAPAPSPSDASSASSSAPASPVTGTMATLDFPGSTPPATARPAAAPPDKKTLRKLNDAVVAYVRNQRGWMDGTYKVVFYGYDDKLTVMEVDLTQGDNAYNFVSAEGQPFKVEIDPATFAVVAERY